MSLLTIYIDLYITKQPQESSIVNCGESVTLCVSAVGSGQISYKWKKDERDITHLNNCTGIDTEVLTITSFSDKYQGSYKCEVKDGVQTIMSTIANVEISKYCS